MPELLTRGETPQSIAGPVAGFKSEWWPDSFRNGGRHQIGTMAGFASEFPAGFRRNPHGITALPLHDSVLVAKSHAGTAKDFMEREFMHRTGARRAFVKVDFGPI